MGTRARVAAAACLVASGLMVGGVGTTTASADPGQTAKGDTASPGRNVGSNRDPVHTRGVRGRDADGTAADQGAQRPSARDDDPRDASPGGKPPPEGVDTADVPAKRDVPAESEVPVAVPRVRIWPRVPAEKEPRPPWCDKGDKDCGPWWPWPPPPQPDPPPTKSEGVSDRPQIPLVVRPFPIPEAPSELFLPEGEPRFADVINTVPGVGVSEGGPVAPVSVPVLVAVPRGVGPGGGGPVASTAGPGLPTTPRQGTVETPPVRQPLPATAGSNVAMPASSYRVGYGQYLRSAGISQIAALAIPGVAGILVLTGAGGLLGYRQAKAGHAVRARGMTRFTN